MKVFLQRYGETCRMNIETLPVLLMNYQWSREQKWNRAWVSRVSTRTPKDPNCDICLKTKKQRASCRRLAGTAENCGDLITADHTVLSEESESRNNHRYAIMVLKISCPMGRLHTKGVLEYNSTDQ